MSDGETDEERQAWAEYWQDGACPMDEQHAFIEGFRAARSAPPPAPPVGGGEAAGDEHRSHPDTLDGRNERYLGLRRYEYALHKELFGETEMRYWPESLQELCRELTRKIGMCGDVLSAIVADWIKGKRASPPTEGRSGGAEILYTGDVGPLDCAVYDEEGRRVPPDLTFPAEPSVREWRLISDHGVVFGMRNQSDTRGWTGRIEYRDVGPWTALPVEPAVRAEAVEADEEGAAEWEHRTGRKTDYALPRQYHETVEDWQARVAMYRNQLAPPAVRAEEEKP